MAKKISSQKCKTPWCNAKVPASRIISNKKKQYCTKCNGSHEIKVLLLQTSYGKHIKEIILEEAQLFNFKSLKLLSDALNTQLRYVRYWIEKYFEMTWDEFRITYKCNNASCSKLDMTGVRNKYYILKMLKDRRICSCLKKDDNSILVRIKTEDQKEMVDLIKDKY